MDFFNNILAKYFGIGGAKVDTILDNFDICQGDKISGKINIFGGKIDQYIDKVILKVNVQYEVEIDDTKTIKKQVIQQLNLKVDKLVLKNQNLSIPFSFRLDHNCPITKGKTYVYISTILDIKGAINKIDGDEIRVSPGKNMQTILDVISSIGFRIKEVETYKKSNYNNFNFVQEFEFKPYKNYNKKLDEIELIFLEDNEGLNIYIEIDRKVRNFKSLLSESLGFDETHTLIYFTNNELNDIEIIKHKLTDLIDKHS